MSRRSDKHPPAAADELREKFIANREQVRSWLAGWDCPELAWPPFSEVPQPWFPRRGEEQEWLERQAPFLTEYRWLCEGRATVPDVTHGYGLWEFGPQHRFESLDIEVACRVLDPVYLAEKLALGAHAAKLEGWQDDDVQYLYDWLLEGADVRPPHEEVRGHNRTGFIMFEFVRTPQVVNGSGVIGHLNMTLTDRALDGTLLDEHGQPVTGPSDRPAAR